MLSAAQENSPMSVVQALDRVLVSLLIIINSVSSDKLLNLYFRM